MSYGPWNPGLNSQVPRELRHMCTIFRPENSFTRVSSATELRQLTGLPLCDLAILRPQRLVLHELMIRVMANLSVPTGEKIGDLGINFRLITNRLLHRYIEPEMESIAAEYASVRGQLATVIRETLAQLTAPPPVPKTGWFRKPPKKPEPSAGLWGPEQIAACERRPAENPLKRAAYRALARVMSSLFTTNGRAWGTPELICSVAT